MRIDGSCHCGAIAFEAEADPETASICHCTDCQAMTGTAFRTNIRVDGPNFRLLRGEPARYLKTTADSGNKRMQAFCPTCGTPIFATAPGDNPPAYTVRIGTLRQRDQLTPKVQNWFRSARPWVTELAAVPSNEKGA
jgi:hypothetical protein